MCNLCRTRRWLSQSGSWTVSCGSSSDLSQTAPCQWSFCPDTPGEDSHRVWENLRLPSLIFLNLLCSFPVLMDTVLVCVLWRSRMDNSGKELVMKNPDQRGLILCVTWSEINEDIKIKKWVTFIISDLCLHSSVCQMYIKGKFKSNTAFVIYTNFFFRLVFFYCDMSKCPLWSWQSVNPNEQRIYFFNVLMNACSVLLPHFEHDEIIHILIFRKCVCFQFCVVMLLSNITAIHNNISVIIKILLKRRILHK